MAGQGKPLPERVIILRPCDHYVTLQLGYFCFSISSWEFLRPIYIQLELLIKDTVTSVISTLALQLPSSHRPPPQVDLILFFQSLKNANLSKSNTRFLATTPTHLVFKHKSNLLTQTGLPLSLIPQF